MPSSRVYVKRSKKSEHPIWKIIHLTFGFAGGILFLIAVILVGIWGFAAIN